jgi:hypothetical protein
MKEILDVTKVCLDWPPETCAIQVMGTNSTEPEIISSLMNACREHGFRPFTSRRTLMVISTIGKWDLKLSFCSVLRLIACHSNRAAIKRESLLVAAEGVANPTEVDSIYKDVLKTPMRPFEQMDVVGLDVALAIEEHYAEFREGLLREPRDLLEQMIHERKLGVKSGEGFYKHGKLHRRRTPGLR